MSRVSIEISEAQHKQLKAAAALAGKSIKDYVLAKALPYSDDEKKAIRELEDFLTPRIAQARRGELSRNSFAAIKDKAYHNVTKS